MCNRKNYIQDEFFDNMLEVEELLNKYAKASGDHVWDYAKFFTQDIDKIEDQLLKWFCHGKIEQ